ncbi:hypothetical protein [Lacticaseibacillus saniviri]|uniref:hypothetical protein n=1 Tax=Lacticaseibacillus saniviri TaxID=931533 RepID=UPI0006D10D0E|nr:hypothetical protein [Lacticaseibacillus saniviri]
MKAKKLLTTVALASALVAPAIMATVSNTAAPTQTVHAASAINDMIAKTVTNQPKFRPRSRHLPLSKVTAMVWVSLKGS